MRTIEHKNIPPGGGGGAGFNQVLIQVQLIHSLPFVTTMKKKNTMTTKKKKDTRAALRASRVIKSAPGCARHNQRVEPVFESPVVPFTSSFPVSSVTVFAVTCESN